MKRNETRDVSLFGEKETFPYQHVFGCVCVSASLSACMYCMEVCETGATGSANLRFCWAGSFWELIWYLAPIGPIRVPLFRTIVAGLKLKPSSSSWLAGLITLIKHHFDRIISLFLHIHSPVCHICISVYLSWIPSSLTIFILSPLPLFSSCSFSTANTCQSRERNLMRVFMWWFL